MELLPIKPHKLSLHEQDIIKSKIIRRWNKTLQAMFEIGYYDSSPKWYWLAVKETLEHADEIANYIPEEELDEYMEIIWEDENIEMERMEDLTQEPIIKRCWILLDRLYDKIKNKNLHYVHIGLLNVFYRIFHKYKLNYD